MAWKPAMVACIVLSALAGCTQADPDRAAKERSFRLLSMGSHSSLDEESAVERVFTDEAAWTEFWEDHTSDLSPPVDAPEVDFGTEAALAVVDETRVSGGHSLSILRVTTDGPATVHYEVRMPDGSCPVTALMTRPFQFVAVQKDVVEGGVVWDRDVKTYDCDS